jgi:tetratricopeptide (TPR) repeat protein
MEQKGLISRFEEILWDPYTEYAQTTRDFAARDFEHALELSESVLNKTENDVLKTCATYRAIVAQTMLTGDFSDGAARLDSLLSRLEDPRTMPNARQQLERFTIVSQQEMDIQQDPENAEKHMILGQTYLQYGNAAQAVTVLTKAKELGGEDTTIDLLLGFGHATLGQTDLADSSFMRYLENNPEDALTLNRIGYTFLGQGLTERALYYFQKYVAVAPDDPNAHDSYGEGLLNAGRIDEAVREYERAIELDETFANSYFMLGTAYRQLDEQEKARLVLEEFLKLSPEGPQADQARQVLIDIEGNSPNNQ